MWHQVAGQIDEIHSMMSQGHRSVTIERHTLFLWGITTALLILLVRWFFTPDHFPVIWHRIVISNLLITVALSCVGYWDFRLTRHIREQHDETVSFTQVQLTKVWWGIVALIVLINIGMNFFGGGYLFYPIMIGLVGLAFYIHGLFSQQLLSWVGIMMVLIGLCSIALQLSLMALEWMTIALFGLGFPLLAWLLQWQSEKFKRSYRLIFSVVWLSMITLPTYAIVQINQKHAIADAPVELLQHFQQNGYRQAGTHIVRLPTGTQVPLRVAMTSPVLTDQVQATLMLTLSQALDIVIEDGVVTGQYRVINDTGDGLWSDPRHKFKLDDFKFDTVLNPTSGPAVAMQFKLRPTP